MTQKNFWIRNFSTDRLWPDWENNVDQWGKSMRALVYTSARVSSKIAYSSAQTHT